MRMTPKTRSTIVNLLDRVRLTETERSAAQRSLQQGESVADFVIKAVAAARSITHLLRRGLRTLSRTRPAN